MPHDVPLLRRFFAKLVLDILPAGLASVIGGFLLTHYQVGRFFAPAPAPAQVAPVSAEMMQLFRDEHALIVDFLKARQAAEASRLAAAESPSRVTAEARPAPAAAVPRRMIVATATARSAPRGRPQLTGAPHPPLVIAQEEQKKSVEPPVRDAETLLAKTVDIKDHVVAVTQRVVGVIGGIPSWIGALGDRVSGESTSLPPAGRLVSAS